MIITESKLDDISKKYLDKFDKDRFISGITPETLIQRLYDGDPSPTKKYFEWMVKQSLDRVEGNYTIDETFIDRIIKNIGIFNENYQKIDDEFLEYNSEEINDVNLRILEGKPLKDINSYTYTLLWVIADVLKNYKTKTQRKKLIKNGAKLLFENENYLIYEINSYEASCFYGSGTRWCTTNKKSDTHFKTYGIGNKKLLYIISKKDTLVSNPQFYKIAVNIHFNNPSVIFYDAPDKTFDGWEYFNHNDNSINSFLISYLKEKSPDDYLMFLPFTLRNIYKQSELGMDDYTLITDLDSLESHNFIKYKYNLSSVDVPYKKLMILSVHKDYFFDDFTVFEKMTLINDNEFLEGKQLSWKNFYRDYYELAEDYIALPMDEFIGKFLNGNKYIILKTPDLFNVFLKYQKKVEELINIFGPDKVMDFIKNKYLSNFSIKTDLFFKNLTFKEKRLFIEKYGDILSEIDSNVGSYGYNTTQFLINKLERKGFLLSFNDNDKDLEIENESYKKAFRYLLKNDKDSLGEVIEINDLTKILSDDKAFSFLMRNYTLFDNELNIYTLVKLFADEYEYKGTKNLNRWEISRLQEIHEVQTGSERLFNYILKKFSFKKLADIIGYDDVFKLFIVLRFKKGINYIINERLGDVRIDDIRFENGKPILVVNDRSDYSFLFKDSDLAEKVLDEDIDWEPYYDVIYNWKDQVWGCINDNSLSLIKKWIGKNIVEIENDEGETFDFENISMDELGDIINDNYDFDDLRNEMSWAYESSYNAVAMDGIIRSFQDELEEFLGPYIKYEYIKRTKRVYDKETQKPKDVEYTDTIFLYDLGDRLYDVLYDYTMNEWGTINHDFNTYFSTLLKESDYQTIYVNTDVYPGGNEICEYFNDDLQSRI